MIQFICVLWKGGKDEKYLLEIYRRSSHWIYSFHQPKQLYTTGLLALFTCNLINCNNCRLDSLVQRQHKKGITAPCFLESQHSCSFAFLIFYGGLTIRRINHHHQQFLIVYCLDIRLLERRFWPIYHAGQTELYGVYFKFSFFLQLRTAQFVAIVVFYYTNGMNTRSDSRQ